MAWMMVVTKAALMAQMTAGRLVVMTALLWAGP